MKFDLFVLPFTVGLAFILLYTVYRFARWISKLSFAEKKKFWLWLFTHKLF